MPRNPPKLLGNQSEDFADYYKAKKTTKSAARAQQIKAEGRFSRGKAKRIANTKNPLKVAQMERARTKPPMKGRTNSKKKFPSGRKWFALLERKVGGTANAFMEMDMRGELASYPKGSKTKGVIRIQNKWGTPPRKRRKVN